MMKHLLIEFFPGLFTNMIPVGCLSMPTNLLMAKRQIRFLYPTATLLVVEMKNVQLPFMMLFGLLVIKFL